MKKAFEKPFAEKIEYDYRNQIVASSQLGHNVLHFTHLSYPVCTKMALWEYECGTMEASIFCDE